MIQENQVFQCQKWWKKMAEMPPLYPLHQVNVKTPPRWHAMPVITIAAPLFWCKKRSRLDFFAGQIFFGDLGRKKDVYYIYIYMIYCWYKIFVLAFWISSLESGRNSMRNPRNNNSCDLPNHSLSEVVRPLDFLHVSGVWGRGNQMLVTLRYHQSQ